MVSLFYMKLFRRALHNSPELIVHFVSALKVCPFHVNQGDKPHTVRCCITQLRMNSWRCGISSTFRQAMMMFMRSEFAQFHFRVPAETKFSALKNYLEIESSNFFMLLSRVSFRNGLVMYRNVDDDNEFTSGY